MTHHGSLPQNLGRFSECRFIIMEIRSAEFVKGIIGTDDVLVDGTPQIAFVGRSNVGKSSVINSLVNRKDLVKSSSTPGKTQEVNFFLVNKEAYFVDLPGYGFAKVPEKRREKLRKLILWYLAESGGQIHKVVLIIDAKVGPSKFDIEMLELLRELRHPVMVILNKSDKLKRNDRQKQVKKIGEQLECDNLFLYSAKTKEGREGLLDEIFV